MFIMLATIFLDSMDFHFDGFLTYLYAFITYIWAFTYDMVMIKKVYEMFTE